MHGTTVKIILKVVFILMSDVMFRIQVNQKVNLQ